VSKAENIIEKSAKEAAELETAKARGEAAKWKRKYHDAITTATSLESQVETLLGIQGQPAIQRFERMAKTRGDVAVVVPASDWHVEERVFEDATNGKNHYDLAEAEKRVKACYAKTLDLIDWQNKMSKVVQLWHPLLGDLMTGYIHEELMETNSLSPVETVDFLQELICSGLDLWTRKTRLPIFIPTCVGNHGRTTPRKRIKTSAQNSYEWLLYQTLAKYYARNKRVHWAVGRGYHNIQEIMGQKVRFHHGDGLRYNGGVGGITIPVNKSVAQWNKVTPCDVDIFGHYHQFLWHYPHWISCPSVMGYSEFSLEIKAEFQRPAQSFIVIDRQQGVSLAIPIYVS
jgi:hypothetical protein